MKGRMKSFVAGMMLILVPFVLGPSASWSMGSRPPVTGMPAADFTLTDLAGQTRSLSQYRGSVVLLNFWATWCKPCTTEMPAMQATYDRLKDKGFVVLAVNELEDDRKVAEHIKAYGHTFPVLMDRDNRVANLYGVYGLPVTVFIDEHGVMREYVKGGLLTEQRILDIVERIKDEQPVRAAAAH